MRRQICVPSVSSIPSINVMIIERIEPAQTRMKSGWLFCMMPSMCLNANRYPFEFCYAHITTIANPNNNPATNEQSIIVNMSATCKGSMFDAKQTLTILPNNNNCDLVCI